MTIDGFDDLFTLAQEKDANNRIVIEIDGMVIWFSKNHDEKFGHSLLILIKAIINGH